MPILQIRDKDGNFIPINVIKGNNGKSAYEQAKEGGYNGTEQEFIALLNGLTDLNYADVNHTHSKSQITDLIIPITLPASDVYPWAKQPNKPSYTASEVGGLEYVEANGDSGKEYVKVGKGASIGGESLFGWQGVSIGKDTSTWGRSVSVGSNASSYGYGVAVGQSAKMSGDKLSKGIAIGTNAEAVGNSIAIGAATVTGGGSIHLGHYSYPLEENEVFAVSGWPLFNIGENRTDVGGGATRGMIFSDRLPIFKGSYTGADAYGESNKVTINLPFVPKAIYIIKEDFSAYTPMPSINGVGTMKVRRGTSDYECTCEWSGTRLRFWNASSAKNQLNEAATYHYIAI